MNLSWTALVQLLDGHQLAQVHHAEDIDLEHIHHLLRLVFREGLEVSIPRITEENVNTTKGFKCSRH